MQLVKHKLGNGKLALGIRGTPEEIRNEVLALQNWGATDGDAMDFGSNRFAYVITNETKLLRAMSGRIETRLVKALDDGTGETEPIVNPELLNSELARAMDSIQTQAFLTSVEPPPIGEEDDWSKPETETD